VANIARGEDPSDPGYKQASVLRSMYWDREMSQQEIADHFETDRGTVQYWMDKHDISRRTPFEAAHAGADRGPEQGDGSESGGEASENLPDGDGSRSPGASEIAAPSQEVARRGDELDRSEFLDRRSFRDLFYSRGLSPAEVSELLDLSPRHLGTLMAYHDVGGLGHGDISDGRISSLRRELSDKEWAQVDR